MNRPANRSWGFSIRRRNWRGKERRSCNSMSTTGMSWAVKDLTAKLGWHERKTGQGGSRCQDRTQRRQKLQHEAHKFTAVATSRTRFEAPPTLTCCKVQSTRVKICSTRATEGEEMAGCLVHNGKVASRIEVEGSKYILPLL